MAGFKRIEDSEVYQLCDEVRGRVRVLLDRGVFSEDPTLEDQIDRSVESPGPNLAEGFARFYPQDNAKFVRVAKGSLYELKEHLGKALAKLYIAKGEYDELIALIESAYRAAGGYARYLESAKYPQPPSRRRRRRRRGGRRENRQP